MKAGLYFRPKKGNPYPHPKPKNGKYIEQYLFQASHIVWAAERMKVEQSATKISGSGSENDPFRMSTIKQWAQAAADTTTTAAYLYNIGGHLIERVPSGLVTEYKDDKGNKLKKKGAYENYVTDVLPKSDNATHGKTNFDHPRRYPAPVGESREPIYRFKYERIATAASADNVAVARQMRDLLKGGTLHNEDLGGLPGIVAALFLAEVYRAPVMLPVGLMLLDLIERQITYGSEGTKTYTIEKMMSDKGAIEALRNHQINPQNRTSDSYDKELEKLAKDARLRGGKHPMTHDNSIAEAPKESFFAVNDVTRRTVSIMCAWLNAYLKNNTQWEVKTFREDDHKYEVVRPSLNNRIKEFKGIIKNWEEDEKRLWERHNMNIMEPQEYSTSHQRTPPHEFYVTAVEPALKKRVETLDCMLK